MHKTGEILMGLRESAGISLEEVSKDINIPVIALEQIEAGTFGSFEDIYELKRWLIEYAKYIGYDTDKVTKEFNEYMFDHTSRIPSNEIVAAIKSNKKDDEIDNPDRVASPYTRAYPKEKTMPYIITVLVVILLVIFVVMWSLSQITVSNKSTDVLSYYTE